MGLQRAGTVGEDAALVPTYGLVAPDTPGGHSADVIQYLPLCSLLVKKKKRYSVRYSVHLVVSLTNVALQLDHSDFNSTSDKSISIALIFQGFHNPLAPFADKEA